MLELDQSTREAIRQSFAQVLSRREAFSDEFYERLFAREPGLRPMFPLDLTEQRRKFVDMLVVIVDAAATGGPVRAILAELGARHVEYGTKVEHYDVVVEVLLETLRGSSAGFAGPVERAWRDLLAAVRDAMLAGAARPNGGTCGDPDPSAG